MLIKALCLGDSGNGKSGALASLALAGYRIHILDYDVKMDSANILQSVLEDDHPEAWSRVRWKTISDRIIFTNNKPTLAIPCNAYKDFGRTLTEWGVDTFTINDVLCLDTLTSLSEAAFHEACALANKRGLAPDGSDHPRPNEYGWMGDSIQLAIELLTSNAVPCHVIVNAHVKITASEEENLTIERNKMGQPTEPFAKALGLPNARGNVIPRVVARFFNNVFYYTRQGPGRVITTRPQGIVDVKTSKIKGVQQFYKIEDGLAKLFEDLGASPPSPPVQAQPAEQPVPQTEKA